MPRTMTPTVSVTPRNSLDDVRPAMAKADLKTLDAAKADVGRVVARCFQLAGLSRKEAAGLLGKDEAQIARWVSGLERPQFDLIKAKPRLRAWLVIAWAEASGDGDLELVLRVPRAG